MAKKPVRPRLLIDTEESHKRAFHLFAASRGMTTPEAFGHMVETHMKAFLKIAQDAIASERKSPPPKS